MLIFSLFVFITLFTKQNFTTTVNNDDFQVTYTHSFPQKKINVDIHSYMLKQLVSSLN